jgi:hypothetical protein
MTSCIAITAKYLGATDTRGSRISLSVPEFNARRFINYSFDFRDTEANALVWLAERNITPDGSAPLERGTCVFTVPRSEWRAIESAFKI